MKNVKRKYNSIVYLLKFKSNKNILNRIVVKLFLSFLVLCFCFRLILHGMFLACGEKKKVKNVEKKMVKLVFNLLWFGAFTI